MNKNAKIQARNFKFQGLKKSVIQSLPLYHPEKGRNLRPRDSFGMLKRASAAYRRCSSECTICRRKKNTARRKIKNFLWLVLGMMKFKFLFFMLKNMICNLGHIKNGKLWPEENQTRSVLVQDTFKWSAISYHCSKSRRVMTDRAWFLEILYHLEIELQRRSTFLHFELW